MHYLLQYRLHPFDKMVYNKERKETDTGFADKQVREKRIRERWQMK